MRPLRFGTQAAAAATGAEWTELARKLERLGYGTFSMPDHVVGGGLASFPALAAAAAATTTLRVGNLVLANDFRNPLMLAREAATVDLLSDGRLELGLGAGWLRRDYESLGIAYDRGATRVDRLREAIVVLKRLFTEEEVTFEGRYYRLSAAVAKPKPVQRPHPPLLVAGGGPRLLALAGEHADIVALIAQVGAEGKMRDPRQVTFAAARDKVGWVRESAGARFAEIELSIFLDVILTDDPERSRAEFARRAEVDVAILRESLYRPIGSVDNVRAHILRARDELGITYFTIRGPHVEELAPLVRELAG
ncbi:MAG: TIGR03621 family F420-dependent LLM class oxidoreductase [Candidatus Limnocylindria bacterium]